MWRRCGGHIWLVWLPWGDMTAGAGHTADSYANTSIFGLLRCACAGVRDRCWQICQHRDWSRVGGARFSTCDVELDFSCEALTSFAPSHGPSSSWCMSRDDDRTSSS